MGRADRERDVFRETAYTPPLPVLLFFGLFLWFGFCAILWQIWRLYTVWGTGVYTTGEQWLLALIYEVSLLLCGTLAIAVCWAVVDERGARYTRFAVIPIRLVLFQAGLLLLAPAALDYVNNVRLLLWGVETVGTVNGVEGAPSDATNRPKGAVFSVSLLTKSDDYVLFRAADGREYRSNPIYYVLGSPVPSLGESARVLYLPENPRISKYPGVGMWAFGIITIPLGSAAWYVLCIWAWEKRPRRRRLSIGRLKKYD